MILEVLGFFGVGQIVLAYFAVQMGILTSEHIRFSVLNLSGASLVFISLLGSDNYAAMCLEAIWILISLLGLYKSSHKKIRTVVVQGS